MTVGSDSTAGSKLIRDIDYFIIQSARFPHINANKDSGVLVFSFNLVQCFAGRIFQEISTLIENKLRTITKVNIVNSMILSAILYRFYF